ncbi:MAG: hypothetical protein K9N46_05565 [Candidatus Marinimicrobia bacterium]|nr:hypothetical protein [Candidatus Neomarinimicrobiota bacterium]MCF7880191.1 hypothetical protein [Candidatus Neomarinimicrobiota bacterium]
MPRHQRRNAESNAQVGKDFEDLAYEHFRNDIPDLTPNFEIPIGIYAQKPHRFDLGSHAHKTLIECKSHTWTAGGNVPSAKLTGWDQAMLYFYLAPRSYRKIMFVKYVWSEKKQESLCEYYLRTHPHVIPDEVEFWEANEGEDTISRVSFDLTAKKYKTE